MQKFRKILCMPIHKKGPKNNVKNYRPINIAATLCNLVEKIMCLQMTYFWEQNNLLNINQYGFRKNHSVGQLINNLKKYLTRKSQKI